MINILFVSIAFPPKNDPESLQVLKYYRNIQKEEVNVDVVTSSNPTLWMKYDNAIAAGLTPPRQLIEIKITEPRILSILIGKYFKFLLRPDSRMSFFMQSGKVVSELKHKPDIIYSRSFPLSSTLMALKLKQRFDVPWILHLSDPWAESPLFNFTGGTKRYHDKMERKCFDKADIISFTSEETINLYSKKYPEMKGKFRLFPNVFDIDDLPEPGNQPVKNDKFRLVYTGSLTGSRHLRYIKNAIDVLQKKYPVALKEIEFIIAGPVDTDMKEMISKGISSLNYLGAVSFQEAKELQNSANILLAVDFLFRKPEQAVYLPSKLLDYILIKKKIIGITNIGSATYNLVHNNYGKCFAHDDATGFAEQVHNYYIDWKNGNFHDNSIELNKKYSAAYNSQELVALAKSLCKRK